MSILYELIIITGNLNPSYNINNVSLLIVWENKLNLLDYFRESKNKDPVPEKSSPKNLNQNVKK